MMMYVYDVQAYNGMYIPIIIDIKAYIVQIPLNCKLVIACSVSLSLLKPLGFLLCVLLHISLGLEAARLKQNTVGGIELPLEFNPLEPQCM